MEKNCVVCGNPFEAKGNNKTCCEEHSFLLRQKKKICAQCGKEFNAITQNGKIKLKQKYCSDKCVKIAKRQKQSIYSKNKWSRDEEYREKSKAEVLKYYSSEKGKAKQTMKEVSKRLQSWEKVDEDITLTKLYERDNGVCWICGRKCDWEDKKEWVNEIGHKYVATFSEYPSIDHVIPLTKEGTHTWDNVKLAHRGCNSRKNNKQEKDTAIEHDE